VTTPKPKTNWLDLGLKLASLLFIPVFGVGMSMWSEQALTKERITHIQSDQAETKTQLDAVNARLNQISTTVQDTHGQLRELRAVLDIIREQVTRQAATPTGRVR
jgi:septal ring factor EnvC (AmiA/AmiB activator)